MKTLTKILLILIIVTSCRSNKIAKQQSDDEIDDILSLTESIIRHDDFRKLSLNVKNHHCYGVYEINSEIKNLGNETVNILTSTIPYLNAETSIDTIIMTKSDFLDILNYERKAIPYQVVIAGSSQVVTIIYNDTTEIFNTRKSIGLVSQLTTGKSNVELNENN